MMDDVQLERDPGREAVGLCLAFIDGGASDELDSEEGDDLAGRILARYNLAGDELQLVAALLALTIFDRDDMELFEARLWDRALYQARVSG